MGNLDPLREDVRRHLAERAADIQPVRHAAGEGDDLAVVEDRLSEGEVVEVAAGDVGVVGDEDVAGLHALEAKMGDLGLHCLGHAADEHGQAETDGNGLALRSEEADGEIERLVDDEVVGGPHQVGLHLLGDGEEAVADDLDGDGVDGGRRGGRGCSSHGGQLPIAMTRLPKASTTRWSPGATTVVEACSSTRAGPAISLPCLRPRRS